MIKTLQKKFIITAMTAVTLLLLVLLGALNAVNAWFTVKQTDELINILSDSKAIPQKPPELRDDSKGLLSHPISENARMSAVYFTAHIDGSGKIIRIDVSKIATVSEEDVESMISEADQLGDSGRLNGFKYKAFPVRDGKESVYVFLDTSEQAYSVTRVLLVSVFTGALCWSLMLLLVVVLSKRAIRPIAENIERQKRFITDAGHELKTPLAIIQANTEAMELHDGESKWSKNIRTQITRLNNLTQDLLTMAKIGESKSEAAVEEVSVSDVLKSSIDMFLQSAELKNISIRQNICGDVRIKASSDHISRLISILIDNAVRYSPENGFIEVSLSKKEKRFELTVRNSCCDTPLADPEKMFDRFYRGDSSRTQKSGGYGIGLSSAAMIVELYKGIISAHYEENNIIVFTVKL